MKGLVIFDSVFGNTERVACAIGDAIGALADVETVRVAEVKPEQLAGLEFLIVGSPTRRFSPTPAVTSFLKRIPRNGLAGVRVAAFDTRFSEREIEESASILPFLVRIFGYAAEPISERLEKKGGERVAPPEGFIVNGTEGPLAEGELDRAADWARQILNRPSRSS